jgi:oligopeptide/dipeptide ABC transporter ATP-binding protein
MCVQTRYSVTHKEQAKEGSHDDNLAYTRRGGRGCGLRRSRRRGGRLRKQWRRGSAASGPSGVLTVTTRGSGELRAQLQPVLAGLLRSFPDLRGERRELRGVPGHPPDLRGELTGCPFRPRCQHPFGPCAAVTPALRGLGDEPLGDGSANGNGARHWQVACHLHDPAHRPLAGPLPREATS